MPFVDENVQRDQLLSTFDVFFKISRQFGAQAGHASISVSDKLAFCFSLPFVRSRQLGSVV
jgi:hypothetical protein